MTADEIRIERERREAVAAERASQLEPGEYHASDNYVMHSDRSIGGFFVPAIECETHWDACLVLFALDKSK